MKTLISVSLVLFTLTLSQTSWADGRHYRWGYDHYGPNPYHYGYRDRRSGSHYGIYVGNSWGYNPYRYNRHYDRRYNRYYNNRHYGRRYYDRHYYDTGSFVGGLILGSMLAPSYTRSQGTVVVRNRTPVVRPKTVVVERTVVENNSVPVGRSLLIDRQGNCYERTVNEQGDEIRTELDPAACGL